MKPTVLIADDDPQLLAMLEEVLSKDFTVITAPTRSGVAGISTCSTPKSASASTMALITAPSAGVVPPSPPPRRPSGFEVDGTSLISVANDGSASARGIT